MSAFQHRIAVVFDFDGTLSRDSTTKLLESKGVNANTFWNKEVKELTNNGWNPTLAYLGVLLEKVGEDKPLGRVSNHDLREFGKTLTFYSGIKDCNPNFFDHLRKVVKEFKLRGQPETPEVEFYIISGGLEEIIRGSEIASEFTKIWGCRLAEVDGIVARISEAITFTEKTKYLFYINKGLTDVPPSRAYAVNTYKPEDDRPIPFRNIIYVGDGLTDIPCFSLINRLGRDIHTFAVYDPEGGPKRSLIEGISEKISDLLIPRRVILLEEPNYNPGEGIASHIESAVMSLCLEIQLRSKSRF